MSKESNSSSGIGFFGLLTILFVALKLTDNIDWGWTWVLSPIWIPIIVVIIVVALIVSIGTLKN